MSIRQCRRFLPDSVVDLFFTYTFNFLYIFDTSYHLSNFKYKLITIILSFLDLSYNPHPHFPTILRRWLCGYSIDGLWLHSYVSVGKSYGSVIRLTGSLSISYIFTSLFPNTLYFRLLKGMSLDNSLTLRGGDVGHSCLPLLITEE